MKPFLFDEVFGVNSNVAVKDAGVSLVHAVLVDNFLTDPVRARDVVGSSPVANWKHVEGGRNFVDYYDCRLRFPVWFPARMIDVAHEIIRTVYKTSTRPQDPAVDVNWFMQIREKRSSYAVPHVDATGAARRSFTCIVYLNSAAECSGGTAFFRFKPSSSPRLDERYARMVEQDSALAETGRDYWAANGSQYWDLIGAIDMAPGRLIVFPSEYYHAAYQPVNSFYDFPRLTLAFWMVS